MAENNITPEQKPVTLKRAAQLLGLDEQEVIDAAALGEIPAGIIVPNLKCHGLPRQLEGTLIRIYSGHYSGGKFITTQFHVQPKAPEPPAEVVSVFVACGFWQIGGDIAEMTRPGASTEINFLWPHAGADLGGIVQFLPWGINGSESMVKLLEPYTITREDLRFLMPAPKADASAGTTTTGGKPDYQEPSKTKGERQVSAILHWITEKGYDPMKLPDGEKGVIRALCEQAEETASLFSAETAFETAWRKARKRELVRMENHSSYAKTNR